MNALVRKEVRLLGPIWWIGAASMLAPGLAGFALPYPSLSLLLAGGAAAALVAALSSFGREFANHCFSNLLALPASRARLWWTKVGTLAAALISLYAVWWASFNLCAIHWPALWDGSRDAGITPVSTALFVLVIFSGGLWTSLLFRQTAAALWIALLLPLALAISADAVVSHLTGETAVYNGALAALTIAYSVGGFLFAWWLFLRAEDAQWTGGTVALPSVPWSGRLAQVSEIRQHQPWSALVRKEFQLHQPMLLVAALLLVIHLGALFLRHVAPGVARLPLMDTVLGVGWGLWLLMPAIISSGAIAEERKLGLMESQLCLPASRQRQWLVKFAVAAALGVTLGTLAPILLEPREHLPRLYTDYNSAGPWHRCDPFLSLVSITFGISLTAFYASSLARNTLQALGFAALVAMVGSFFFNVFEHPAFFFGTDLWLGNLGLVLGYPASAIALVALSRTNFQGATITSRQGVRNVLVLAAVFLGTTITATAVYHRAWESLSNLEPTIGATRLTAADAPVLQHDGQLSAQTASGEVLLFPQIWRARKASFWNTAVFSEQWSRASLGSNWVEHVSTYFETVGIRDDGTLWASEHALPGTIRSTEAPEPPAPLGQFGKETTWKSVVRDPTHGRSVLLLKTDGTLWRWQTTNHANRVPLLTSAVPTRLGHDTDWVGLTSAGPRVYLTTTSGEVWGLNLPSRQFTRTTASRANGQVREPEPGWHLELVDAPVRTQPGGHPIAAAGTYDIFVRDDGSLWASGVLLWTWHRSGGGQTLMPLDLGTNWRAVTANFSAGLAMQRDGSLWQIDLGDRDNGPTVRRLSRQTHWLAIASSSDALFALATDGSVWSWSTYAYRQGPIEIGPSRIPVRVASLFEPNK